MQPSDRSKPPKMTLGPLPTPPGGARPPQTPPPASKGAPAVGTGILSGSGLNFGPAYVPPRRQSALEGQPVLVTVPSPRTPRAPPPNVPLPMTGVIEAYAKGAKKPVVWPDAPTAKPATPPPTPVAAPEPPPVVDVPEDPGPAPAWMAAAGGGAKRANRTPLYVGGAALLAVGAFAAFTLLTRHPSQPAPAPAPAIVEQPAAPPTTAPAAEPLRPQMDVATAEAPPTIRPEPAPKPAARPRKVEVAAAQPAPKPAARASALPPVQVTPQPLAIAPPPAVAQQPPPRIIIPHLDPSAPIVTRSPGLD